MAAHRHVVMYASVIKMVKHAFAYWAKRVIISESKNMGHCHGRHYSGFAPFRRPTGAKLHEKQKNRKIFTK